MKLRYLTALAIGFALSGCVSNSPSMTTKVITFDQGGLLKSRYAQLETMVKTKQPVEIAGRCTSACTMYLILENTCVHPDAILGFHRPTSFGVARGNDYDTNFVSKFYPGDLREWYLNGPAKHSFGFTNLSGQQVHELTNGEVELCTQ